MSYYSKVTLSLLVINAGICLTPSNSSASSIDSIVSTLESLTCETQGIGNLLRNDYSHTCITAPFSTFVVYSIISPINYPGMLLKLRINDDNLFPNACRRNNKIPFDNQRLSFGVCSNALLIPAKAGVIADAAEVIFGTAADDIEAIFTGNLNNVHGISSETWASIADSWNVAEEDYIERFDNQPDGATGSVDLIQWKVATINDAMCVEVETLFGWKPVGCKYIAEPYPQSIYNLLKSNGSYSTPITETVQALTTCNSLNSCYGRAVNNSQNALVISAPLIQCMTEMAVRLMVDSEICSFGDISLISNPSTNNGTLYNFQANMRRAVTAFLSIYVVFFGFRILLANEPLPRNEIINAALKIILVTYFSIGISVVDGGWRYDGITQWVLPFLFSGINEIAGWVMNASSSGLCYFNPQSYEAGYSYLALWDALDCRVSYYLGLDPVAYALLNNAAATNNTSLMDFFSYPIPPYFYFLVPALMSGNVILINLVIMYPILIISVAAYMLNATIVCILGIVILSVLSPLFVPMVLFQRTKNYFESWAKLLLSFMLQPMVVSAFLIVMFTIFDQGFFSDCQFNSTQLDVGNRSVTMFDIDTNFGSNSYTPSQASNCQNSIGYILNSFFSNLRTTYNPSTQPGDYLNAALNNQSNILSQFSYSQGLFINTPSISFQSIKDFVLGMIVACFTLFIMYHLSEQINDFATDMTEGIDIGAAAIKPLTIFNAGQQLAKNVSQAIQKANAIKKSSNPSSSRSSGAQDLISRSKARKAEDLISSSKKGSAIGETDELQGDKDTIPEAAAEDKISTDRNLKADFSGPEAQDNISVGRNLKADFSRPATEDRISKIVSKNENAYDSKSPSEQPKEQELTRRSTIDKRDAYANVIEELKASKSFIGRQSIENGFGPVETNDSPRETNYSDDKPKETNYDNKS